MSEKNLKYLIYIWGAICLCAFFAIRFEALFNSVLKEDVVENYWDKTEYGELYYFSMIRHFREDGLPPAKRKFEHSEKQASVKDCDILVFGDSFFEFSRHKQIPERLADDFSKKVHFVNGDYPLEYLTSAGYRDTFPKLVIIERVERYIPLAFEGPHIFKPAQTTDIQLPFNPLSYIREKLFYESSEELYDLMIKRSYPSTGLNSLFATLKFDMYGKISKLTPAYLKDNPNSWLFYHDQVNEAKTSFYFQHTDEQIDSICDHMADLSKQLESQNMHLLFLPVPAKYTLYHDLINDDPYTEFLPRLYMGLDQRGVKYINIFDNFLESDTLLYYRTDSHWNQKGIDIAYEETLRFIKSDSTLNSFL